MKKRQPNERQQGESPRQYSIRMRNERIDAEIEENDRKEREKRERQESCSHYDCAPVRWDWETGKVREMYCSDCEQTRFYEEDDNGQTS